MKYLLPYIALAVFTISVPARAWLADNGDGTFTNPLFYDEFSDLDLIRVGGDFYFTGTTMHALPGLPVLHSKVFQGKTFQGVRYWLFNFNDSDVAGGYADFDSDEPLPRGLVQPIPFGKSFDYEAPANSLTVIRMKSK